MKILIKTSGDSSGDDKLVEFIKEKAKKNKIVVICGGGTQINNALREAGYEINFNDHGRVLKSPQEDEIVCSILEKERKDLENKIKNKKIIVLSPLLFAGPIICHINGDNIVKSFYLGFDKIYLFTLKSRIEKKKEIFKSYPKVKIIGV